MHNRDCNKTFPLLGEERKIVYRKQEVTKCREGSRGKKWKKKKRGMNKEMEEYKRKEGKMK